MTTLAAECHRALDPLHMTCYFTAEVERRFTEAGLEPGSMAYFAGRAAPFGPVGPGVVAAAFYNFNPALIAEHLPRAWELAAPSDVLAARLSGVDEALRRLLGDQVLGPDVVEAADLVREAAEHCTPEGRPLFAAHADLPWPEAPHLALWHGITLLREHRGDGHLAALLGHGLSGIGALITDTATGGSLFSPEQARATRGWSEQQWDAEAAALAERGVLTADGALTTAGRRLRHRVEEATDAAAAAPYRRIGTDRATRLRELVGPLSAAVVRAGVLPGTAPEPAGEH